MTAQQDGAKVRGYGYAPRTHAFWMSILLIVLWLALSGHFHSPLLLGLGLLSVVVSVFFAMRMDLLDHEGVPVQFGPKIFAYWIWLLKEIFKANLDVAKLVVQAKPDISPTIFDAPVSQKTDLGQVLYANSITLTPGTVSIDLDPGVIQVHALTRDGMDGVLTGDMDHRVSEIEAAG